jgi:hypothetical protein
MSPPPALLLSLLLLLFSSAEAGSKVAFLEVFDSHGRLIQYETGSQFGHTALEIKTPSGSLWLQSHPEGGAKMISWNELQKLGRLAEVIELQRTYRPADVKKFLGASFDFEYLWDNETLYCSELIGKVLGIEPEPMEFNRKVWPKNYWTLEGQPGLSPDKLLRALRAL